MNNLFSLLVEEIKTYNGFESIDIPISFQHKLSERPQGSLELKSVSYRLTRYGEFRAVVIHSQKIDIISSFFYPFAKWHLPIYAMEFVSLGKKPIVGVLDLPCLSGKEHIASQSLMYQLLEKYQFKQSDDYPIWYQECRSNYDIFTRPESHMIFESLAQAHRDIMKNLSIFVKNTPQLPKDESIKHKGKIRAYQQHHLINSPGLPLMNNMFDQQWTKSFLEEWFFAELPEY